MALGGLMSSGSSSIDLRKKECLISSGCSPLKQCNAFPFSLSILLIILLNFRVVGGQCHFVFHLPVLRWLGDPPGQPLRSEFLESLIKTLFDFQSTISKWR